MVYDRYAGTVSLPGPDGKARRPFRVDEDGKVIYSNEELDAVRDLGKDNPTRLAEASNPAWNGYEVMREQGGRDGQALRQTAQAADAFWDNFDRMREADTIGADKYFHCKANSEASSLGQYGEDAAEALSDIRELFGQVVKGDPVIDSMDDQRANFAGGRAGRKLRSGQPGENQHRKACAPFRPAALDRRY